MDYGSFFLRSHSVCFVRAEPETPFCCRWIDRELLSEQSYCRFDYFMARISIRDGSHHFSLWLQPLSLRPAAHSHDPHHHSRIRVLLSQFSAAGALHAALPRRSLRDHRQYSPNLFLIHRLPQHLLQLPHAPHRPRQRRAVLPAVRVLPCRLPLLRRHVVLHQRVLHFFHSSQHVNLSLYLLFRLHRGNILSPLSYQSLPLRTSHQQSSSSSLPSPADRQLH